MHILFWIATSALYLLWLWAPLAITIGVVLWARARKTDRQRDYALLLTLVAPWLIGAFWAVAFANRPAFAAEPTVGLLAELALAVGLAIGLKRIRRAAILLGLLNLYVAVGVWLWGEMAVSGSWI